MKKKVLWVVGGVGWAYDIQFKAVSERSIEYEHVAVSRLAPIDDILNRIKKHNPDIIVIMTPSFLSCLSGCVGKIIGYLPSFSAIGTIEDSE